MNATQARISSGRDWVLLKRMRDWVSSTTSIMFSFPENCVSGPILVYNTDKSGASLPTRKTRGERLSHQPF